MIYSKAIQVIKPRSWLKLLDGIFSEIIRRRAIKRKGGCERCGTQYSDYKRLQCSHIISRNNYKVRWDLDNAFGLCAGCHMYLEHNPVEHVDFAQSKIGVTGFDMLRARSNTVQKLDYNLIHLYLKEEMRKVK